MSNQEEQPSQGFVVTKGYRRFAEMCDACRRARAVGLGYGPPGTGKTESATYYAQWNLIEPFLPESLITFTGHYAVDDLYPYRPSPFLQRLWTRLSSSAEPSSILPRWQILPDALKKKC